MKPFQLEVIGLQVAGIELLWGIVWCEPEVSKVLMGLNS